MLINKKKWGFTKTQFYTVLFYTVLPFLSSRERNKRNNDITIYSGEKCESL